MNRDGADVAVDGAAKERDVDDAVVVVVVEDAAPNVNKDAVDLVGSAAEEELEAAAAPN